MNIEKANKILSAIDLHKGATMGFPPIHVLSDAFRQSTASGRRKMLRPATLKAFEKVIGVAGTMEHIVNGSSTLRKAGGIRPTYSSFRDYTSDAAIIAMALGLQSSNEYIAAMMNSTDCFIDSNHSTGFLLGFNVKTYENICIAFNKGKGIVDPTSFMSQLIEDVIQAIEVVEKEKAKGSPVPEAEQRSYAGLDLQELLGVFAVLVADGVPDSDAIAGMNGLHGVNTMTLDAARNLIELAESQGNTIDVPASVTVGMSDAINSIKAVVEAESAPVTEAGAVERGPSYVVPTGLKTALDAVLASASLPPIESLIAELDDNKKQVVALETRISKMPTISVNKTPADVAATGELPSGGAKWRNALEILLEKGIPVPRKAKGLFEFEVPYFEWDAAHRDVPAIDPDYRWRWDILAKLMWGLAFNKKPWIWGHTGTGKTTLVEQVAAILNWPFIRINFDSEITRMDLVGRDTLVTDEHGHPTSHFQDGILPQAMSAPTIICNDELDFVRSDIAYVYQRALEDKGLLLTEDGGRLVKPHQYSRMVATANTQGQGDEFGLYQGARVQSQAFLDRFQCWIEVPYLPEAAERELIEAKVPALPKEMVSRVVKYVTEHREAFKQAAILKPISPRGVVSMSEAISFFTNLSKASGRDEKNGVKLALETTVLGSVTHADAAKINELVDRTFN